MTKIYNIDASGQKLGRVASDIAAILLGKKSADFQKHEIADVKVEVSNASKMAIDERKSRGKVYRHYTGHRGGLRDQTLGEVVAKKGYAEILIKAVKGMIHNTKMKPQIMKNLTVNE